MVFKNIKRPFDRTRIVGKSVSRKDFERSALVLSQVKDKENRRRLVGFSEDVFQKANPRFRKDVFEKRVRDLSKKDLI
jgi:hypothetical protein